MIDSSSSGRAPENRPVGTPTPPDAGVEPPPPAALPEQAAAADVVCGALGRGVLVDGEPSGMLRELIEANHFEADEIAVLAELPPGARFTVGGGGWATFEIEILPDPPEHTCAELDVAIAMANMLTAPQALGLYILWRVRMAGYFMGARSSRSTSLANYVGQPERMKISARVGESLVQLGLANRLHDETFDRTRYEITRLGVAVSRARSEG